MVEFHTVIDVVQISFQFPYRELAVNHLVGRNRRNYGNTITSYIREQTVISLDISGGEILVFYL